MPIVLLHSVLFFFGSRWSVVVAMVTELSLFGGPLFVVVGVVFVARVSLHHQSARNGVYIL